MATASAADPRLKLGLAMLGEPVGFFFFRICLGFLALWVSGVLVGAICPLVNVCGYLQCRGSGFRFGV